MTLARLLGQRHDGIIHCLYISNDEVKRINNKNICFSLFTKLYGLTRSFEIGLTIALLGYVFSKISLIFLRLKLQMKTTKLLLLSYFIMRYEEFVRCVYVCEVAVCEKRVLSKRYQILINNFMKNCLETFKFCKRWRWWSFAFMSTI